MRPIHHIKYLINLNREMYRYSKSLSLLSRVLILEILDAGKKIAPKTMEKIMFHAKKILGKYYYFQTPFGNYLSHSYNAVWVMQENYEPEIKEVIQKNIERNKGKENYFFNIGGHIGRWAIDLAYNHQYHGVVFEPSPETFRMLQVNTILSGVQDKLVLHNFGLGDANAELQFAYYPSHDGGSRVITDPDNTDTEGAQIIHVPLRVFDDMVGNAISKEMIRNTRLIIMDVE